MRIVRETKGFVSRRCAMDDRWKGIIHSEEPHPDFQKTGGTLHGFQIWVNLPSEHKMMNPRYQDILLTNPSHRGRRNLGSCYCRRGLESTP